MRKSYSHTTSSRDKGEKASSHNPGAGNASGESRLTEYFYALTPDRILEAFSQAGICCQPAVRFLNSLENRVASVQDEEGTRWVAKFYRPARHSRAALLEEHQFLKELQDEGLPVIAPLELRTGGPGTLGSTAGIFFAIFPHHTGGPPDELDVEKSALLGKLIARIHEVGSRKPSAHRHSWDPGTLGEADLSVLARFMPADIWSRYERSARRLIDRISPRLAKTPMGRIHGDFHRGNLLWPSAGPLIVDFDDMTMGPPVQDLWMIVPGRDAEACELREALIEGYETQRRFDMQSLELMEPLRAFRFIHYAAWLAARQKDPAFIRVLDEFGTQSYWRDELAELEGQMELFM